MKKEVTIQIEACHQIEEVSEEREYIRAKVCGVYYEEEGYRYLEYEQVLEEGCAPVWHQLKFDDHSMAMTKRLEEDAVMEFQEGEMIETLYDTPYGCLDLEVTTESLRIQEKEETIDIAVAYQLTMQGGFLSRCELTVKTM